MDQAAPAPAWWNQLTNLRLVVGCAFALISTLTLGGWIAGSTFSAITRDVFELRHDLETAVREGQSARLAIERRTAELETRQAASDVQARQVGQALAGMQAQTEAIRTSIEDLKNIVLGRWRTGAATP